VLETGPEMMTGRRIKHARDIVGSETFSLTYGDGVSNVDIRKLIRFDRERSKWATVTAVEAAFLNRMFGPPAMSKGDLDVQNLGERNGLGHRCEFRHWARDRLNSCSF
jgi:NDP-sugar pyrophosphorylase family protein